MKLKDILYNCRDCGLYRTRLHPVEGEGNAINPIAVVIGEAPGYAEDKIGKPFVGESGKYLRQLLREYNITFDDIYLTNIVKCRPPNNDTPIQAEVDACSKYLKVQLSKLNPKIVMTLGNIALNAFVTNSVTNIRGKLYNWNGKIFIASWHPAAILYKNTVEEKNIIVRQLKYDIELLSNEILKLR